MVSMVVRKRNMVVRKRNTYLVELLPHNTL